MTEHAESEHISDDGLTALCGESLINDDPPTRPVCSACEARLDGRKSLWGWTVAAVRRLDPR